TPMSNQGVPIREVSAREALELAAAGYRIIDVREPVEWNEGHIPTATLVPLADLPARIADVAPDQGAPLLLHCAVGARSQRAAAYLGSIGYTKVASLRGPIADWHHLGGPRSEEHTSELQSRGHLVCRLLLEKK